MENKTSAQNKIWKSSEMPIDINQGSLLTAFGQLRVESFKPLAGWTFAYNVNPGIVKVTVENGGSVDHVIHSASINTGVDPDGYASISTINGVRYIPGMGAVVRFACVFGEPKENSVQLFGVGNGLDGLFFGYLGLSFGILRRQNGVDFWTLQEDWSQGLMPNLNPQTGNVYEIKYQWLGYGPQIFSIEKPFARIEVVHFERYVNTFVEPSIFNPNVPITARVENKGNTENITLLTSSAIAGIEGDYLNEALAVKEGIDVQKEISTGTLIPLIAGRLSDIYFGKANRLFARITRLSLSTDGNKSVIFRVFVGGTVTGGTWSYTNESLSPLQINKTFTSYTPGILRGTFPLTKVSDSSFSFSGTLERLNAGTDFVLVAETPSLSTVTAGINLETFI